MSKTPVIDAIDPQKYALVFFDTSSISLNELAKNTKLKKESFVVIKRKDLKLPNCVYWYLEITFQLYQSKHRIR